MSYCDEYDIMAALPWFDFDATSTPTLTDVIQFCADAQEKEIDPIIRAYATIPVTDSTALLFLEGMATDWVCAHVLRIMKGDADNILQFQARFDNKMAEIRRNPAILTAGASGSDPTAPGGSSRDTARYMDRDDCTFARGRDDW